ncbi:MAG: thiamine diphosphokinase [Lachnospiraceae bacterium]|nr:thiamine diphosphokinase [Lachnospiraceae bacterium]
MRTCYLVGAGDFGSGTLQPKEDDLVIACDGGFSSCMSRGINIDYVIGDFDSLGYVPEAESCLRLPVEKDVTDMEAGVDVALGLGYRYFEIFGGTGGRLSHTIANIQMMIGLSAKGIRCILHGENSLIYVLSDDINGCRITFPADKKGSISLFAVAGPVLGLTISGMKYTVTACTLEPSFPLGVSNSFIGSDSFIEFSKGRLLVIEES